MATLAELVAGKTLAQQRQALFDALADPAHGGFPVTSWREGDIARTLVEVDAQALVEHWGLIGDIAAGGLLEKSEGDWLTLLARQVYQVQRQPAVTAEGAVVLTAAAGAGPYVVGPGALRVATPAGLRYQSTNPANVTVPQGGSVSVPVRAEAAGVAYNVANGAITVMLTTFAGVTVSNPDPGSGTWLTMPGVDVEADEALKSRCRARWPETGFGSPGASYDLWARTAAASITRTRVQPNGTIGGQVDVYVAGPAGAVPGGDVAAALAYIAARAPMCVTPVVVNATANAVTVTATLYGKAQYETAALVAAAAALQEVFAGVAIGGTIYRAALFEALMSPVGVENAVIAAPAGDVTQTAAQVAVLTPALSWSST